MDPPETHYAKTDDGLSIAYQTLGDGPTDIVLMPVMQCVDLMWEEPSFAHVLRRMLASDASSASTLVASALPLRFRSAHFLRRRRGWKTLGSSSMRWARQPQTSSVTEGSRGWGCCSRRRTRSARTHSCSSKPTHGRY